MSLPPAIRFAALALLIYVVVPLYLGNKLGGVPGLISVAAGLLSALFLYGEVPRHAYSEIPGPPRKWLVGNLEECVKKGYHKFYGEVAEQYGLVATAQMGHWPQIIISDPEVIRQVGLEKFDFFRDRKTPFSLRRNKGLLMSKGEQWHSSRRALNPAFNSIKLSAFAGIISRHCEALVKRLDRIVDKDSGPIDVLRIFGDLTMDVIGSTSFDAEFALQETEAGTPVVGKKEADSTTEKDQQKKYILDAAKTIFMSSSPLGSGGPIQMFVAVVMPFLGPLFKLLYPILQTPESKLLWKSVQSLGNITGEILDGRSKFCPSPSEAFSAGGKSSQPGANFIDLVRKARDPDTGIGLSSEEVRDQLNLFVLAGYETTANTLAYTAFLVAQHPQVEARLLEEIQRLAPNKQKSLCFKDLAEFTYTSNVVNEALRLYPPGAMLSRETQKDVTLSSGKKKYHLKKDTRVIVPVFSIHRDSRFFENPESFDPDRFLPERSASRPKYAYLPFGVGPRACIGQRFALEEIKLALIAIYREHTFKLHQTTELPLKLRAGITLSPAEGIWMTVHRR